MKTYFRDISSIDLDQIISMDNCKASEIYEKEVS